MLGFKHRVEIWDEDASEWVPMVPKFIELTGIGPCEPTRDDGA